MAHEPHWTAVVSALAIAAVAVFGAYLAWNQWKTNHDILRERLFDRRFDLTETTQGLIATIVAEGEVSWENANRFTGIAQRARFLFSADDAQYFELLSLKALDLATVTAKTDGKRASQVEGAIAEQRAICTWFNDQIEELFLRMSKYIHFER
jgi:hypothetical protein